MKQSTLGYYYLKQKELTSAKNIFESMLSFVEDPAMQEALLNDEGNSHNKQKNQLEIYTCLQIALFNMAVYQEQATLHGLSSSAKKGKEVDSRVLNEVDSTTVNASIEKNYVKALIAVPNMHISTVKKILSALKALYFATGNKKACEKVDIIAKAYDFQLQVDNGTSANSGSGSGVKRVAFAIDYSGSMAGTKIRAAVENLQSIFKNNIYNSDSMMLIKFTESVDVMLPLMKKLGNENIIMQKISSLTAPCGSTAFYDAIMTGVSSLNIDSTSNDWLIALTDGSDNSSKTSLYNTIDTIQRQTNLGVIVIGVGSDVERDSLERIAKASSKGIFVFAEGDKKSISDAFGRVAMIIQGEVLLEEM